LIPLIVIDDPMGNGLGVIALNVRVATLLLIVNPVTATVEGFVPADVCPSSQI
jgi:hypothetical protein